MHPAAFEEPLVEPRRRFVQPCRRIAGLKTCPAAGGRVPRRDKLRPPGAGDE